MGIHYLTKIINEKASNSIKEHDLTYYDGKKIAIDGTMAIHQFIMSGIKPSFMNIINETGENIRLTFS